MNQLMMDGFGLSCRMLRTVRKQKQMLIKIKNGRRKRNAASQNVHLQTGTGFSSGQRREESLLVDTR